MESEVRELLGTIQQPHLRVAARAGLRRGLRAVGGYRVAPAAKYYHQAYRHGLLEHSPGGRPGGERDQRHLPRASTATSP